MSGMVSGSSSGNGASSSISYLEGTTTSTITFPASSVPTLYTICLLTRYKTVGTKGRILIAGGNLYGHLGGNRGPYYDGGFKKSNSNVGIQTDWLNMVITNNSSISAPSEIGKLLNHLT
jgi:hypothetical protein